MNHKIYSDENIKDADVFLLLELLHLIVALLRQHGPPEHHTGFRDGDHFGRLENYFENFSITLKKLAFLPDHNGKVLIIGKIQEQKLNSWNPILEYEIYFGKSIIDMRRFQEMIERNGERMAYLYGLLRHAFDTLNQNGIFSLFLKLPSESQSYYDNLKHSISVMAHWFQMVGYSQRSDWSSNRDISFPFVFNALGIPDFNLTNFAILNDLSPDRMRLLVQNVSKWFSKSENTKGSHRYVSVYDAIASSLDVNNRFVKPVIEVNNIRWLLTGVQEGKISKNKACLSRIMIGLFQMSIPNAVACLQTLYGRDQRIASSAEILERLKLISELLSSLTKHAKRDILLDEIFSNLQLQLMNVPRMVLETICINGKNVNICDGGAVPVRSVHIDNQNILNMLDFFKKRAHTRSKMLNTLKGFQQFDCDDFEILAREFDISPVDARDIMKCIMSSFDPAGKFVKEQFEHHLHPILKQEKKVFEILWQYLKEPQQKLDRLAFFKAVQTFIVYLKKPEEIALFLFEEVISNSKNVQLSDRNATMLSILLLRDYNKEIDINFEITPEEIFWVKNGLNEAAVQSTKAYLEQLDERLFCKLTTIHRCIVRSLKEEELGEFSLSTKFLLSLERELLILLSLTGGPTAHAVLKEASDVYGNPDNLLYRIATTDRIRQNLVQQLKVVLRGLSRIGNYEDAERIRQIHDRKDQFLKLSDDPRYGLLVRNMTESAGKAISEIRARVGVGAAHSPERRAL